MILPRPGDNNYYNPLGFESACRYHVYLPGTSEDDEAVFFMAKELEEGYLGNNNGIYDFDICFNVSEEELEIFDRKFPEKSKREARETDLT